MTRSQLFISLEIECSGPVPIDYSMLSLGACIVGREEGDHDNDSVFYVEMKPISDNYVKEALDVCNFSLATTGYEKVC
jgi:ribonuclease T